jgi:hypothetical protein
MIFLSFCVVSILFNYIKYPLNTAVRLAVKYMLIRISLLLQLYPQAFPSLRVYYTVAIRNSYSHHPHCQLHRAQSSLHYHTHSTVVTSLSCTQRSRHFTVIHRKQSSLHYHANSAVITSLSCTQRSHHFTITRTAQSSLHFHAHSTVITSLSSTQRSHQFTIMYTAQSSLHYHAQNTVITSLSCTQYSHHFSMMHSCLLPLSVSIFHIFISTELSVH